VGHIAKAIRTDPVAGERVASRSHVQEQRVAAPNADITLRRTVKDEVFVRPVGAPAPNIVAAPNTAAAPGEPIAPPAATDSRSTDKNDKM